MKSLAGDQKNFYSTLQNNYTQQFNGQSAILSKLSSSFEPILSAGENQYGFSAPEDAALRTQASEATAAQYQNAKKATGEAISSIGGGNAVLPNGTSAELIAENANKAAADESTKQLGITTAGYETGRENFDKAASVLGGVSAQMNPTAYASSASTAGNDAFSSADSIWQANNSAWQTLAGAAGGAASSFLQGYGQGKGKGSN